MILLYKDKNHFEHTAFLCERFCGRDVELDIDDYRVCFWEAGSDKCEYCAYPLDDDKYRTVSLTPATWVTHAHGNAPSGTYYGSYRITLPNGKRRTIQVYL